MPLARILNPPNSCRNATPPRRRLNHARVCGGSLRGYGRRRTYGRSRQTQKGTTMAKQQPGNQTAGTPDLSETELREMKIDDLRERAREEGVSGASSLRKEELVDAISALHREGRAGSSGNRSGKGSGNGSGNDTPDTPGLSETELREMKIDDLRERAREEGVSGASSMKKEELVDAVSARYRDGGGSGAAGARGSGNDGEPTEQDLAAEEIGAPGDRGPDKGRMRTGS